MAVFPAEWLIYRADDFASFQLAPLADTGMTVQTLMLLKPDCSPSAHFRVCIAGRDHVTAHFTLAKVLANAPPNLAGTILTYSAPIASISPPQNAASTAWVDLEALLRDRSVLPGQGADQNKVLKLLIAYLGSLDKSKQGEGASLRWAITGSAALGGLQLELQALPSAAKLLTKNNLKGDNAVSVVISTTQLHAELFDGVSHAGPVPMFFANDRRAARAALNDDPDEVYDAIKAVNSKFLYPEHLTLQEAVAYLQAPKARAAKGTRDFTTMATGSQATGAASGTSYNAGSSKRARLNTQEPSDNEDTGKIITIVR
jgi:hypothetical protein